MNRLPSSNAAGLFIDITQDSLRALNGGDAFAFPLQRGESGRLTDLCREKLTADLRAFLGHKGRAAGRPAFCAIGARGVSMRRLALPAASKEELQRVLRLQIESQFPLSPDELAWGSRPVGPPKPPANGGPACQDLLVVAVKKEALQEYADLLGACGLAPLFTLAALARAELHPPPSPSGAVLDLGRTHSELMLFDGGAPASIRILPWGGEAITRAIQDHLALNRDEAEKLKLAPDPPGAASDPRAPLLQSARETALASLAKSLQGGLSGGTLYLTGKSARDPRLAPILARLLGGAVDCQSLELAPASAPSAALAGLIKSSARNGASSLLMLEHNGGQSTARPARPNARKWAAAAVGLALAAFAFPYAQAFLLKPVLEKRLAALQADRGRLATLIRNWTFSNFSSRRSLLILTRFTCSPGRRPGHAFGRPVHGPPAANLHPAENGQRRASQRFSLQTPGFGLVHQRHGRGADPATRPPGHRADDRRIKAGGIAQTHRPGTARQKK